jgi:hypothetical protein
MACPFQQRQIEEGSEVGKAFPDAARRTDFPLENLSELLFSTDLYVQLAVRLKKPR